MSKFGIDLSFQNTIRRSPQFSPTKNWKIKSAVKEKLRDLSSSSKNFERDTYKGGRGAEGITGFRSCVCITGGSTSTVFRFVRSTSIFRKSKVPKITRIKIDWKEKYEA